MARPHKFTVDYFPHDANASQGRTLTILYNNFGHEGISAWWQLLETISSTNNHVIYLRNDEDMEYLAAKMHFKPERLKEILDKLAYLDAIDKELWKLNIIWCQNLVQRLKTVYDSRRQKLPEKPDVLVDNNSVSVANNPVSVANNPVKLSDNTQTKLNKTKLNNIKDIITMVYDHWNKQQIIVHRSLTGNESAIKTALKHYSADEIKQAISNYAQIVLDNTGEYYFDYRWTLKDFLRCGLEKFLDGEIAKRNYRKNGNDIKPGPALDNENRQLIEELDRR